MNEFTYTIQDPQGMHARPAGKIAAIAQSYPGRVTLWKGEEGVDVKKLLPLIGTNLKQGDTVIIRVEGENEEQAASSMEAAFKENI